MSRIRLVAVLVWGDAGVRVISFGSYRWDMRLGSRFAMLAVVVAVVAASCSTEIADPSAATIRTTTTDASEPTTPGSDLETAGYVDLCDGSEVVEGELPDWAWKARSLMGSWTLTEQANAVVRISSSVEGYPQGEKSALWLFADPPSGILDLSVVAIEVTTGERVDAASLSQSASGFFRSVLRLPNPGCWELLASWGIHKATARTFVAG